MASVKGNIILSILNTVVGLLFPLVTFPYVSRVLMPEGIGVVQFYQAIINYIVLLSALGIPLYAVREVSKVRDNREKRNKETVEIFVLHGILSIIGYLIVFILIATVAKIRADWPLFLLLSLFIALNVLGVYWFYQAMEEFKYITIRSLIVKFSAAIAMFLLVKTKNDIYWYAAILVCIEAGNYIFNFIRLRRYVRLRTYRFRDLDIWRHLRPAFKIFLLNFSISMYVNLNPIMLGFMTDDTYVGYYAAVRRIIIAGNGLTVAIGNALLPRLSNYFATGRLDDYAVLKKKALDIIMLLCIPISICTAIIAPVLLPVFSGDAYIPGIPTLQLSAPTLLISALNYIIAIQILYSQNKENIVILATSAGGVANIIVNFILIPHYQQNGAAIGSCLGELTVLLVCLIIGFSYISYNFFNSNNLQALISALICGAGVWGVGHIGFDSKIIELICQFVSGIVIYSIALLLIRNALFVGYVRTFSYKIIGLVKGKVK